jgi:hypothetical protein
MADAERLAVEPASRCRTRRFEPSGTVNTGNVVDADYIAPTGIVI